MLKRFIFDLLQEYQEKRGYARRLFGNDGYICRLQVFYADIESIGLDEPIVGENLRALYDILKQRFNSGSSSFSRDYASNVRLTNHIYHKLIFEFAEDLYVAKLEAKEKGVAEIDSMADKDDYPEVIVDFNYAKVLGQRNAMNNAWMSPLEDLAPSLLALTQSNHLIYLPDVVALYQQHSEFRNPEADIKAGETPQLTLSEMRRICKSKPEFYSQWNELHQQDKSEHLERLASKNQKPITTKMTKKIKSLGKAMEGDQDKSIAVSHQALFDLSIFLDNLPDVSKKAILDFKYRRVHPKTFNDVIKQKDVCRHVLGSEIVACIEKMEKVVSTDFEYKSLCEELDLQTDKILYTDQINGLGR